MPQIFFTWFQEQFIQWKHIGFEKWNCAHNGRENKTGYFAYKVNIFFTANVLVKIGPKESDVQ